MEKTFSNNNETVLRQVVTMCFDLLKEIDKDDLLTDDYEDDDITVIDVIAIESLHKGTSYYDISPVLYEVIDSFLDDIIERHLTKKQRKELCVDFDNENTSELDLANLMFEQMIEEHFQTEKIQNYIKHL